MNPFEDGRTSSLFAQIRDLIAAIAEKESEIPAVLRALAETKTWEPHFAHASEKKAAFDTHWNDFWSTSETCSRCDKTGMRREITSLVGVPDYGRYCPACTEIVKAAYHRNCLYCAKSYTASAINRYAELC